MRSPIFLLAVFAIVVSAYSGNGQYHFFASGHVLPLILNETYDKLQKCANTAQWSAWVQTIDIVNKTNFTDEKSVVRAVRVVRLASLGLLQPLVRCSVGEVQKIVGRLASVTQEDIVKSVSKHQKRFVWNLQNALTAWRIGFIMLSGNELGDLISLLCFDRISQQQS